MSRTNNNIPSTSPEPALRSARAGLRVLAVLTLLAGLVAGSALGWQLWWTDVQAADRSETLVASLRHDFDLTGPDMSVVVAADPPGETDPPAARQPEGAIVHLPTIGEVLPVLEGTGSEVLDQGVLGRYPGSASPGEIGNYAVAGHRTTYGRPLWALGDLTEGDPIIVETGDSYHVYEYRRSRVVRPDDVSVLAPVPGQAGEAPSEAWMVLTTCHPRFSAQQRLIGYAVLDRSVPRTAGPPAELRAPAAQGGGLHTTTPVG